MIVRSKAGPKDILFAVSGSILPRIMGRLALIGAITVVAIVTADLHPAMFAPISAIPFTLVGIALSIFISFRNNACYDRWWEGRKLWGQFVIACRCLARQAAMLAATDQQRILRGACGFGYGLAARLRGDDDAPAITRWSDAEDWERYPNATDALLRHVGRHCLGLLKAGTISDIHYSVLDAQLAQLSHVQAGCERIATTPLPFAYSLLLHRTAYIFCITLPFALAATLGWWTLLPVLLVSYTFFGLDALGDQLEEPFGLEPNDLPLDAITRSVEREMLAALGETDLPEPILARDNILL